MTSMEQAREAIRLASPLIAWSGNDAPLAIHEALGRWRQLPAVQAALKEPR